MTLPGARPGRMGDALVGQSNRNHIVRKQIRPRATRMGPREPLLHMVRIPIDSAWELRLPAEELARRDRQLVLRVLGGWMGLLLLAALC